MYKYLYNHYVVKDLEAAGIAVAYINYASGELRVDVPTADVDDAEAIVLDTLDAEGVYAQVVDRVVLGYLTQIYFEA